MYVIKRRKDGHYYCGSKTVSHYSGDLEKAFRFTFSEAEKYCTRDEDIYQMLGTQLGPKVN